MTEPFLRQEDIAFQSSLYQSKNPMRRWLHCSRRDWVLGAISRHFSGRASRVLEVGIGCGIYTGGLGRLGSVVAIDINPDFVASVKDLPGVDARLQDVLVLGMSNEFDGALCSEVIEHIGNSSLALKNMGEALRPGGLLILTTPNSYSIVELCARLLGLAWVRRALRSVYGESVEDLGHINRLTRAQLAEQIRDAEFEVVETTDIGLYLPGVGEFGGAIAVALARRLERWCSRHALLRSLLWAQCYVLRKQHRHGA